MGRPRGRVGADLIEGLALVAIGMAVLYGGGALLVQLRRFEPAGVALVALAIIGFSLSINRVLFAGGSSARLAVTVRAAYLTGLILVLIAILVPLRATAGAAIAMIELAIAFDLFSRFVPTRVGP